MRQELIDGIKDRDDEDEDIIELNKLLNKLFI